jgi:twitching motility protein PilT
MDAKDLTAHDLLLFGVEHHASDVYIQTGAIPSVRIDGQVHTINSPPLTEQQVREFIQSLAPSGTPLDVGAAMAKGFDFSYVMPDHGRFRYSLYSHLGAPGLVVRIISLQPPSLESLNLPPVIAELAHTRRGLILMSGSTGSGKSSTLAGLIEALNNEYRIKILTIEDPVEFVHTPRKAIISQVEVGKDTPSFEHGLRQAMRQAPDVILIGELRDAETVRMALRAADTGHQVLATVHSSNAAQTIERILATVPPEETSIVRQQLAWALAGVISQRLAVSVKGPRRPVVEVLRGDSVTSKYILEGKLTNIAEYIATGENKMQTFDMHAVQLVHQGILSRPEALRVCSNPDAVQFKMWSGDAHSNESVAELKMESSRGEL